MSGNELPINADTAISIVLHNVDVTPIEREYAADCLESLLAHVKELRSEVEQLKRAADFWKEQATNNLATVQQLERENAELRAAAQYAIANVGKYARGKNEADIIDKLKAALGGASE